MDVTDDGPDTLEDVMLWAGRVSGAACSVLGSGTSGSNDVLRCMGQTTYMFTTSYSGMGVAEMSLPFLQDAIEMRGGQLNYVLHGATEKDELCQRMLRNHGPRTRSSHLFGDILERISSEVLAALADMQKKYLNLYNAAMKKHGKATAKKRKECVDQFGRSFVAEAVEYLSQSPISKDATSYCFAHDCMCPLWPAETSNRIHVEVAGNTCTPWSTSGKQMGWLDSESIPCIVWLYSMQCVSPSILVNECTPLFDAEILRRLFQKTHHFATHVFGPPLLGIPACRDRRYTVLMRKDRCSDLRLFDQDQFSKILAAPMVSQGSLFMRASSVLVQAFLNDMAGPRGLASVPERSQGSAQPFHAALVLSPWLRLQLTKYKKVLQESPRFAGKKNIFVDLSQNPDERPRVHEMIPCLLRNSFLWSMEFQRPLHPLEILAVQCIPVLLPSGSKYSNFCPWSADFLDGLSRTQVQQIAGNSMVLPAVGSVLLLALLQASCVPVRV